MPCKFILYVRFIYIPADMIVEEKWILRRWKLVNAHFGLPRICPGCLQSYCSSCNQTEAYLRLPRSLSQALGSSFKPSSEYRSFIFWPKTQLPLKLLILPRLPLHVVPVPCAVAACCAVKPRPCSSVRRLRHPCARRQPAWPRPAAKLGVTLTTQKQEKSALLREVPAVLDFPGCLAQISSPAGEPAKHAVP